MRWKIEIDADYDTNKHGIFEKELELICAKYDASIEPMEEEY